MNYTQIRTDFACCLATGEVQRVHAPGVDCLCKCEVKNGKLVIEIAHLQHAGTDAVILLGKLADSYAKLHGLTAVELIVHTAQCALPNVKLQKALARRNFAPANHSSIGKIYTRTVQIIT